MTTADRSPQPSFMGRLRLSLGVAAALGAAPLVMPLVAGVALDSLAGRTLLIAAYGLLAVWMVGGPRWLGAPLRRGLADLPSPPYAELQPWTDTLVRLVASLQDMLAEAETAAARVATVQEEIVGRCERQVAGATEQSQAVSETSTAAAELSCTSEQIGTHIRNVSQMAEHVLSGMANIKAAADQTNRILMSLNEKSKQIGHITDLIDDVADQTNLLAVNASIEAARAGEHGRGFTVVADQIGKLADSTGKSTKDITALVEVIQHEMSNAIVAMEQSLAGVEEEIKLTKDSAVQSREIAANASQQIAGSRQIAQAIAAIDETMKQIVDDAQRAAGEAAGLAGVAEDLRRHVLCHRDAVGVTATASAAPGDQP